MMRRLGRAEMAAAVSAIELFRMCRPMGTLAAFSSAATPAPPAMPARHRHQALQELKRSLLRGKPTAATAAYEAYLLHGGHPHRYLIHDLMDLHVRLGQPSQVLALLSQLKTQAAGGGQGPNAHSYAYAINAIKSPWHRSGSLPVAAARQAVALLEEMCGAGLDSGAHMVVWNDVMDCLGKAGLIDEAFALYNRALASGLRPQPHTFSILLKACETAGQVDRADEVVRKLMPEAGVAPTTGTWNGLLGVFASAGSVDQAYQVWSDMAESGVMPDVHTERVLARAFASHPQLAADLVGEARKVADDARAARQRKQPSQPSSANGASASSTRAGEEAAEWEGLVQRISQGPGSRAGVAAEGGGGEGKVGVTLSRQMPIRLDPLAQGRHSAADLGLTMAGPTRPGIQWTADSGAPQVGGSEAGADLSELLTLDLHGHSQPAANMALLRRLEVLVQAWPELQAAAAEAAALGARTHMSAQPTHVMQGQGQAQWQRPGQHASQALVLGPEAALCIVTGMGRNSREGQGVLKATVRGALAQQGLPAVDHVTNPGRVLVPWPELAEFLGAQREQLQRDRVLDAARKRYTWVGAGVAGLAGLALIVPRLQPWL